MALLDMLGGMGGGQGGQVDPMQLLQMLQMSQKDPFSKPLPGEGLLGPGGMSPQQPMGQPAQAPGMPGQAPQNPASSTISTDFADTQPGLPNLPDTFKGFGFGQYAPEEHKPDPRQQLIQQLLQALSMGGGQGMGGF